MWDEKKLLAEKIENLNIRLKTLQSELNRQIRINKLLRQRIMDFKNTNIWKIVTLLRRLRMEFFNGGIEGKKRFLRWVLFKIIGRPRKGHLPLTAFDVIPLHDLPGEDFASVFDLNTLPVYPRSRLHIHIFTSMPYEDTGGGQRAAQLAKTFALQGYDVTYVYAFPRSESQNVDLMRPFKDHYCISEVSEEFILRNIRGRPLFIFEIPYEKYLPYLYLARRIRAKVIYDHIDNWETSLGKAFFSQDVFREFLLKADLLVASAKLLVEQIAEKLGNAEKPVFYLPNAYDEKLFEPSRFYQKPADMPIGERVFIYIGSLWGEWFCWDWLIKAAETYPQYKFVLIGDYSEKRSLPANIVPLGLKAHAELPPYLAYSSGGIIPFKPGPIVDAVSPIKVFECLGMHKPVISTLMPEIKNYPGVYQAGNLEEWLALFAGDLTVPESVKAFNQENNWNCRCEQLVNLIGQEKISVIVLCHNNVNIIGRCLESLLKYNSYDYEIIVVDNQSTDGSVDYMKENYGEKIKIIQNSKNGCASGRNLGAAEASGEILVFLDSDQWATHFRWLDPALEVLALDRRIGAVGWTAGWFTPGKVTGPTADFLPSRGSNWFTSLKYRCDVAYLGSGGMVIPRYIWEQTGGFDEAYDPTCFEDTDLSLSIKFLGYSLAYCPFIGLGHLANQTTQSGSLKHRENFKRNAAYCYNKWHLKAPELLKVYLNE